MKVLLKKAADKVNGLSLRERVMFALLSASSVFAITNYLVVVPVETKIVLLEKLIVANQKTLDDAKKALREIDTTLDPKKKLLLRESQLDEKLARANDEMAKFQKKIVPKDDVPKWVAALLPENSKVALESIETLTIEPLAVVNNVKDATARAKLYRHTMSVSLRGTYEDLTTYMRVLEKLHVQINWLSAVLDGKNSPSCTLTLTFYTVSTDEKWIHL